MPTTRRRNGLRRLILVVAVTVFLAAATSIVVNIVTTAPLPRWLGWVKGNTAWWTLAGICLASIIVGVIAARREAAPEEPRQKKAIRRKPSERLVFEQLKTDSSGSSTHTKIFDRTVAKQFLEMQGPGFEPEEEEEE